MKPRHAYAALCLLGTVIPYWWFLPWLADHGLDLPLFARELFSTRVGGFFGLDVVVSAVTVCVFVILEGRRLAMRHLWAPVLATLLVGVSLGLPLFLYLRETRLEKGA